MRTVTTVCTDDIDGEVGAQEVRFRIEGVDYAVDLSPTNRAIFMELFRPYVEAGRRVRFVGSVVPAAERRSRRIRNDAGELVGRAS